MIGLLRVTTTEPQGDFCGKTAPPAEDYLVNPIQNFLIKQETQKRGRIAPAPFN